MSAFGDHGMTAIAAFPSKARLCLSIMPFDVSKLHRPSPQAVCSNNCSRLVGNPPDFLRRVPDAAPCNNTNANTNTDANTNADADADAAE